MKINEIEKKLKKIMSIVFTIDESKIDIKETEITLVPKNSVSTDLETSLKLYKLLEALEDLDDTQNVYSNAVFPDEMVNHLD